MRGWADELEDVSLHVVVAEAAEEKVNALNLVREEGVAEADGREA